MKSTLIRDSGLAKRYKVHTRPAPCQECGFTPILASSFDVAARVKLFWWECPNDECESRPNAPLPSVRQGVQKWNESNNLTQ